MPEAGNRYAIVVGVSDYTKAEIADLQFAANDAARLARVLIEKAGFSAENVRLFCDGPDAQLNMAARVPSHSDILAATAQFADCAKPEDLVLFFFAGHGNEISETPYLLTNDTRLSVIRDTALPVENIRDYLNRSAARCTIRLFDACRAAQSAARGMTPRPMSDDFAAALLQVPGGSVTFTACSSGEYAYEHLDLRQGVFSYYICQGLSGLAARDDGLVTVERLVDYVKLSVANECERRQLKQTPQFTGQTTGTVVLASSGGPKAAVPSAPDATGPVASLVSFFQQFHGTREAAVARARVTHESELESLVPRVFALVNQELRRLESLSLKVIVTDGPLRDVSRAVFAELQAHIAAMGLGALWHERVVAARQFELNSAAAYLPSSVLTFAVVRFSYFYWVWVFADPKPANKAMKAKLVPPRLRDYCTLVSSALDNPEAVDASCAWVLRRVTETLETWTKQCEEQVAAEMKKVSDSVRSFD